MAETYQCPYCGGVEILKEKLENGTGKNGTEHRRQRFECQDCHYQELIHAEGARDVEKYEWVDRATAEALEDEKKERFKIKNKI